jgi:hypothetical protein
MRGGRLAYVQRLLFQFLVNLSVQLQGLSADFYIDGEWGLSTEGTPLDTWEGGQEATLVRVPTSRQVYYTAT